MEFNEILKTNEFIGVVEDNKDPDKKGRIKVRVPYLHGDIKDIPTTSLPWSTPVKSNNNGLSSSIPDINKIVTIIFPNGELYYPEYKNALHLNLNLQKKIETLSDTDYTSFVALCYNHNTQIYISTSEGLNMYHKKSGMQITDSGDVITRLNGTKSKYYVGDKTASQAMLLSNNFFQWFDTFIDSLPTAYMGNNGILTVAQPGLVSAINQYKSQKNKFMSENAFISDNGAISDNNIQTEIIIGDKYTNTIQNKELQAKVVETQKIEKQQNKLIETAKEENIKTESDEKINETFSATHEELVKEIEINLQIDTSNFVEVPATSSVPINEGTNAINDEEDDNPFESDSTTFTGDIQESNDDENPEFLDAEVSDEELASYGDSVTIESNKASYSKKINFKEGIEKLDMTILKEKNGTYYFSEYMAYDKGLRLSAHPNNHPDNNDHLKNLKKIFTEFFDTAFVFFKNEGYSLCLNSGYRSKAVNDATKGASSTSQHKTGSAIDIKLLDKNGNMKNNLLFYYLKNKFWGNFGQLIWEGNEGDGPRWAHISLNNAGTTNDVRTLAGGVRKKPNKETIEILSRTGIISKATA